MANAFSRLIGGFLSDKYGRKKVLWIGTLLVAGTYLLMALAPDWQSFALANVLNGISLFYQPALEGIQADSIPVALRGRMNAVLQLVPGLATSISPICGAYIVNTFGILEGMRIIYSLSFTTGVATAITRLLWIDETVTLRESSSAGKNILLSYTDALKRLSPEVYLLMTTDIMLNLIGAMSLLGNYYMYYYLKVSKSDLALLATMGSITNLSLLLPVGRIVDTRGRNLSITMGFILGTLSQAFFVLAPPSSAYTMPLLTLSSVIGSVGGVFYGLAYSSLRADLVPKEYRGRVYAIWGIIPAFAWSIGAMIGGWMYNSLGPTTPFISSLTLRLLLAPLLLSMFKQLTSRVDRIIRSVEGS
jgi:MFS family permease